jgi:hypothetical protein
MEEDQRSFAVARNSEARTVGAVEAEVEAEVNFVQLSRLGSKHRPGNALRPLRQLDKIHFCLHLRLHSGFISLRLWPGVATGGPAWGMPVS